MNVTSSQVASWALTSERLRFGTARSLGPSEHAGRGKALLAASCTVVPTPASELRLGLEPITSERQWQLYEQHRIVVEAGFGVDAAGARAMVASLRDEAARLQLTMWFATAAGAVVGAAGYFPVPGTPAARLQEVDIFPACRRRGHGNALLTAMSSHLAEKGYRVALVGADEDDWPLHWYRRHAFTDVGRVPLTR